MIAVVLQHMQGCKARAMEVFPDGRQSWFPLLAAATVRSVPVAAWGGAGTFFRMHHQKGRVSFVVWQWGMRAVEVNFRQELTHNDKSYWYKWRYTTVRHR